MLDIRLIEGIFSPAGALHAFTAAHGEAGGVASFCGQVRPGGGVEALELTHYAPLTLAGMEDIVQKAQARFVLDGALAWHRVGTMMPGEPIVLLAAAATHRRNAIDAVDFVMDHLKSAAWFWKREKRSDGWHWISPREADHEDIARWR